VCLFGVDLGKIVSSLCMVQQAGSLMMTFCNPADTHLKKDISMSSDIARRPKRWHIFTLIFKNISENFLESLWGVLPISDLVDLAQTLHDRGGNI
jgi:hypothetical protein